MSERKPYPITDAVVRQRTDAATRHGGRSESQISASARAHKRRLMRQMNLRIGDLDGIALRMFFPALGAGELELASYLRIEEREREAGGLNQPSGGCQWALTGGVRMYPGRKQSVSRWRNRGMGLCATGKVGRC
jgi:hypothetical protein